jgi:hypothetical protein
MCFSKPDLHALSGGNSHQTVLPFCGLPVVSFPRKAPENALRPGAQHFSKKRVSRVALVRLLAEIRWA